jgi:hypothetical protein
LRRRRRRDGRFNRLCRGPGQLQVDLESLRPLVEQLVQSALDFFILHHADQLCIPAGRCA